MSDRKELKRNIMKSNASVFLFGMTMGAVFLLLVGVGVAVFYAGTQQIVSTVTTGTSPFTVTSTTKVTSLNADLLDDLDSTDLQDSPGSWTCVNRTGASDSGTGVNTDSVTCQGSEVMVTGTCGWRYWDNGIDEIGSYPIDNGWECKSRAISADSEVVAYAECCT